MTRRVVITGLGCVTAIAEGAEDFFSALCQGKNGISNIESFDTTEYPVKIGGEIKDFKISDYISHREGKRMDPFTQYAVASAIQAVKDGDIDFEKIDKSRVGVLVGTGIGGIKEIEEQHLRLLKKGPGKVSAFCVPKLMGNAASGCISIQFALTGPNMCAVTACASASHAIGEAYYQILNERADMMLTGGSEAALSPIGLASFCSLKALSTRNDQPHKASRPFDKERDGFVLSEGAGILVLEEYEHAKKRNAKIYAELLGYGATGDGYHITAPMPDGKGASKAMKMALDGAKIQPEKVNYINAHGTSTELNDLAEVLAVKSVFGNHVYDLAISSTKSCTGHLLGASGAVELVASAKTIEKNILPPTINLDNVDERCDTKINFVAKEKQQAKVDYAMSNSLGFGGHNSTLIIGRI
jgi:3-oxoacyl-[acyl-carrier-protein] synthase II